MAHLDSYEGLQPFRLDALEEHTRIWDAWDQPSSRFSGSSRVQGFSRGATRVLPC